MRDRYTIADILHENTAAGVYRGYRSRDGVPVIIKTVYEEVAGGHEHRCLPLEYEIMRRLDSPYVLKPYELNRQKSKSRLILEYFDGEALSGRIDQPIETDRFLDIVLQMSAALSDIHRQGIVHNDLKPANILVNSGTGAVRLMGFCCTTRLTRFPATPARVIPMEGSLPYISPERIGYMNRGVDHRSDLYSLGIIFYQMLTGKLPFQAADPLEWVHCHIARPPKPLTGIVPAIPGPLAAIVLKLLEKEPGERYQSAEGLLQDLVHCRDEWIANGAVEPFPLGRKDASGRFLISGRFYGRKKEVAILSETFRQAASGQTRLMLISGCSGIGKSALVKELHRSVAVAGGYFITGKFDQYQRDVPYAPLIPAFHALFQQILAESDERVKAWGTALKMALGANGRIIVDLIPLLEKIAGPQEPVPVLPPVEARHRFHMVFCRFVSVFSKKEHPLVLFLDDLQWLDPGSLDLMAFLATRTDPQALLIIGAYRDNEVGPAHPLTGVLNEIRQSGISMRQLNLGPLRTGDLTCMVADTLRLLPAEARPLSGLIHGKTAGNPFFAVRFLSLLFQENLLVYDPVATKWRWDLQSILMQNFTDNIVELMLDKINRFSAASRKSLMLAACIGHTAGLAILAKVCGRTEEKLQADLQEAIDEGLLYRMDDCCKFLHDRVQEAAYALLPKTERPGRHLQIGRLLLSHYSKDKLNGNIFEIAGHLNQGADLIIDPQERSRLAELNLAAGWQARLAAAYKSAAQYFAAGAAMLGSGIPQSSYDLVFSLHLEQAECEYLSGNFNHSGVLLDAALVLARSLLDKARVFRLRQRLCQLSGRFFEATRVALEALRLFGISMPETDKDILKAFNAEILLVEDNLRGRRIIDLAGISLTNDAEARVLIGLMAEASPLFYTARPLLWPLITAKGVNLSLERGHADESPFIYSCYSMVLTGVCRDIPSALRFSKMAIKLSDHLPGAAVWRGKVMFHEAAVVGIWGRHFMENLPLLDQAFRVCIDSGDLVHAGYLTYNAIWLHLENGDPLDRVAELARRHTDFARQIHNDIVYNVDRMEEQFIRCLQGKTRSLTDFDDDAFDETDCVAAIEQSGFHLGTAYHHIMKLMAAYLAGRYEEALQWAGRTAPMLLQVASMANEATYHVYHALTLSALYKGAPAGRQLQFMEILQDILAKLEYWADHCPANFSGRHNLVRAEIACIEKRGQDAMKLYEKAIALERENGFIQNEAVACEAAAMFYQQQGFEKFARIYLAEAADRYHQWGAAGKVRHLERLHPWLAHHRQPSMSTLAERLDAVSVARAQQAISGEIRPDRLAMTLLKIVMESAGAQAGYLSVEGAGNLRAEMKPDTGGSPGIVFDTDPDVLNIPGAIANYVRHSRKTVILADAGAASGGFPADDYLRRVRPRSVLCMPIQRQEKLLAVLYLENNLVTGAFTPERCFVLEVLASQAAVSLETAAVYGALEESEARLRLTLEAARIGIFDWDLEQDTWLGSPEYYTMLGYTPVQGFADREEWLERVYPDDRAHVEAAIRDMLDRKPCPDQPLKYRYEARMRHADGTYRWVKVTGFGIRQDKKGRMSRILGVRTDITESRLAEEALHRLNTELDQRVLDRTALLETANRELEAFAYSVSHDLRAPLRHIDGFLELLQKKAGPALDRQCRRYMDNITDSAQKMNRLIEDLLFFSRMGRQDLTLRQVNLKALADHIIRGVGPDIVNRAIEWHIGDLPEVMADAPMLRIVLDNLIANALKFTRQSQQARIEIGCLSGPAEIIIFIRDNGVGFDMAYADKLFGVFQRLHSEAEFEGTGIGLATVQRIIARHGGRTWAEAQVGKGAAFFFSLPEKPLKGNNAICQPDSVGWEKDHMQLKGRFHD